jgi:hypothetical protein
LQESGYRPQQVNIRPSADLQNDFGSDERESACKPGVLLEAAHDRRTASPESVRPDADEQGDCRNEKDLQMRAFQRAADGIRTHDLLHGKKNVGDGHGPQRACKQAVSCASARRPGVWDFTAIDGSLRTD